MHSLVTFFSLTYIASWILWIAAVVLPGGNTSSLADPTNLRGFLVFLGALTPSLVALALTARADGRAGTAALLGRLAEWPAQARWYVFAVAYMASIKLAVALLHRLATGAWPAFGQVAWYIVIVAIVFSTPVQAGEEIGWRGYALPRLARRLGLPAASILLGIIWACWHLPFFFIAGVDKTDQSFPVYLLAVTAISVAMAWLYWRTHGSLLLTMLMHAAINNTATIVQTPVSAAVNPFTLRTSLVAWLTAALLWVCAVYFLVRMRGATLRSEWGASSHMRVEETAY